MPFAPSQGALQYRLSGAAIHLQIGFAHFPCFSSAMCLASLPQRHSPISVDTVGEVVVSFYGGCVPWLLAFLVPFGYDHTSVADTRPRHPGQDEESPLLTRRQVGSRFSLMLKTRKSSTRAFRTQKRYRGGMWIGAVPPRVTLSRADHWSIRQPNAAPAMPSRIGIGDTGDEPSGPAAGGSRRSQRATIRTVPPRSRGVRAMLPVGTQTAEHVHEQCHEQHRPEDPQAPAGSPMGIAVVAAASAEQQHQHNNEK